MAKKLLPIFQMPQESALAGLIQTVTIIFNLYTKMSSSKNRHEYLILHASSLTLSYGPSIESWGLDEPC